MIKVDELLKRPSNIEKMSDGRLFIKSLNKKKISNASRGNTKVVVQDEDGNILHEFDTITACAKFLDVSNDVVSRTLISKGKSIIKDSKLLYVKFPLKKIRFSMLSCVLSPTSFLVSLPCLVLY
jgi:hypothetical protein